MRPVKLPLYLFITTMVLHSCTGYNIMVDTFPKPKTTLIKSNKPTPGWEYLPIYYDDERPTAPYDLVARIIVTGNSGASEDKLLKKLKKEASCIGADAILFSDRRYVLRNSVNGVAIAVNVASVITIFAGDAIYVDPMEVEEEYEACEIEAIAIRFKNWEE